MGLMKAYVHARLSPDDRARLEELKQVTGESESSLVKRGLRLAHEREVGKRRSALDLARRYAGKFSGGPKDLSTNKKHLESFGR
jgi:hypothetical protein